MLEILKPWAFFCVEAKPEEIIARRQLDKNRPLRTVETSESIHEHVSINRSYCAAYSAQSGALLRFIQNNTGEFERGVDEFAETLRAIGDKK
jgi:adenylate kinase